MKERFPSLKREYNIIWKELNLTKANLRTYTSGLRIPSVRRWTQRESVFWRSPEAAGSTHCPRLVTGVQYGKEVGCWNTVGLLTVLKTRDLTACRLRDPTITNPPARTPFALQHLCILHRSKALNHQKGWGQPHSSLFGQIKKLKILNSYLISCTVYYLWLISELLHPGVFALRHKSPRCPPPLCPWSHHAYRWLFK